MNNLTLARLDAYNSVRIAITKAVGEFGTTATAAQVEKLLNNLDQQNYWTIEPVDVKQAEKNVPDHWGINYGNEMRKND